MQRKDLIFSIKSVDIVTVVGISQQIPELENPYPESEYRKRLKDVPHLILAAFSEAKAVGFKVGYERDGAFYSWMGGVLPDWRRHGVAQKLAQSQEDWARKNGYDIIRFKTRNRHKAMLIFALKNGFHITGFEKKGTIPDWRILLEKPL